MSSKRFAVFWLAALALTLVLAVALAALAAPNGSAEAAPRPDRAALFSAPSAITTTNNPTGTVLITAVDAESFPDLTVYVAVNDAGGQHVAQLPSAAFTLAENSAAVPADKLTVAEKEVGIQVVFTLDTSAPFKTRDINAVTRLDYIKQALEAFATQTSPPRLADGIDDVTLLAPEGVLTAHASQGRDFANALAAYTTSFSGAANSVPLVNQALDFASETMPRPGMPRSVVLFSNGLVAGGQAASLTDLVTRAQSAQVAIDTVYVGFGGANDTVGAQSLVKLAELTGGQFLVLEKPESLAPLLNHLADQRLQYQLRYRSSLAVTGQQSFSVQVTLPDGSRIASNAASFPLRIEPPTVALSPLPDVIHLSASTSANEVVSYTVPVAVDFPDGHPRNLRSVELLADGQVVDQQLTPTASLSLRWNLSSYKSGGAHTLVARAADELGFEAQSAPVTVTLSFAASGAPASQPGAATKGAVAKSQPSLTPLMWAGIGLLAVALVVGLGGLWWLRRTAGAPPAGPRPSRQSRMPSQPKVRNQAGDKTIPLRTTPVPPPSTRPLVRPPARPPAFSFHTPALFPPKRTAPTATPQGKAYLEIVEGGGAPRGPIEILGSMLRLGRDPARAEAVFQDRSVSRLHARIVEAPEGVFRIYDEGSTSGTWVNFTQIPAEGGWELKPGDLINLGRIQLRFKRRAQVSGPGQPAAGAGPGPGASDSDQAALADGATEPYRPPKK